MNKEKYLEVLKKHTDRRSRKLLNANSIEVRVAMTKLCLRGFEGLLDEYKEWLESENREEELLNDFIKNS